MDRFERALRTWQIAGAICGNRRQTKRALDAIKAAFAVLSAEEQAANAHRVPP